MYHRLYTCHISYYISFKPILSDFFVLKAFHFIYFYANNIVSFRIHHRYWTVTNVDIYIYIPDMSVNIVSTMNILFYSDEFSIFIRKLKKYIIIIIAQ